MTKTENPYLGLNIYRDRLFDAIADFFITKGSSCTYSNEFEEKNGGRHRLHFTENNVSIFLDFRFNQNGTTSIDLSSGLTLPIKNELADHIKNSSICCEPSVVGLDKSFFVFNNMILTDFEVLLDVILDEQNAAVTSIIDSSTGKRWSIKGDFGQTLTITYYYSSRKVILQGKPLKIFMEFYTHLMSLFEPSEIPKILETNKVIDTNINKDDILNELPTMLPNSYNIINPKIRRILCQALFNIRHYSQINFDYSQLAFPALKGLEGHLKHVMFEKGIPLVDRRFNMFRKLPSGEYYLPNQSHSEKFSENELKAITTAYKYYKLNRHSVFHWDDLDLDMGVAVDTTRMLDNPGEVISIITSTFEIVDSYYIQ